jgi:hypothetical protein
MNKDLVLTALKLNKKRNLHWKKTLYFDELTILVD